MNHFVAAAAFSLSAAAITVPAAANTEVPFGCSSPEAVPALQQQVLSTGMIPVAARFVGIKDDEFVQQTIMMNPATGVGLNWSKTSSGRVCILTKYENVRIFNHGSFDDRSFISVSGVARDKVHFNSVLKQLSAAKSHNPMISAIATTPTNAAINLPIQYYEFMLGSRFNQSGAVIIATLNGEFVQRGTKYIPSPSEKPVKFGAIFTPAGEDILTPRK